MNFTLLYHSAINMNKSKSVKTPSINTLRQGKCLRKKDKRDKKITFYLFYMLLYVNITNCKKIMQNKPKIEAA
jgi:hypothetical protein